MPDISVLFEDDSLLAINKPAGLVVNRADSVREMTLQDWIENRPQWQKRVKDEISRVFLMRSGIGHRLDKDTSGVLLIGKTPEALTNIMKQFKERSTQKSYVALVHGRVEPKEAIWKLPIARDPLRRKQFRIDPFGKQAETAYRVDRYLKVLKAPYKPAYPEGLTYIHLYPKTGRTHQLRVHLKHINHPIVADYVYGGRRAQADLVWCPRHFLHAYRIEFSHPINGSRMELIAPLSEDLLRAMRFIEEA